MSGKFTLISALFIFVYHLICTSLKSNKNSVKIAECRFVKISSTFHNLLVNFKMS